MASSTLAQEIAAQLAADGLCPTSAWITSFLQTIQDINRPLPALKSTARFRLLASDITESIQTALESCFPADIQNGIIKERKLPGPILVQVLDIEDIGHSRWSQVESIEAAERGETTKGREVIRVVPGEDNQGDAEPAPAASAGPHKLLLQDAKGMCVYGSELSNVHGLDVAMNIGAKLLLKDIVVARGVLLLEPRSVQVVGGKIDKMHKAWRDGRKDRLKAAAGMREGG